MSALLFAKSYSSLKNSLKLRFLLSLLLIIVGVGLVFIASWKFVAESKNIDQESGAVEIEQRIAKPTKIYIPKLSRTLEVSDGEVVNNRWVISATGVSYLTASAIPGNVGNAVIYGHNKRNILGGLPEVKEGDSVYIVTNNGEVFRYTIIERREVKPTQVEILKQSDDSRLTIYTCNGFLDQARFVVVGRLETTTI